MYEVLFKVETAAEQFGTCCSGNENVFLSRRSWDLIRTKFDEYSDGHEWNFSTQYKSDVCTLLADQHLCCNKIFPSRPRPSDSTSSPTSFPSSQSSVIIEQSMLVVRSIDIHYGVQSHLKMMEVLDSCMQDNYRSLRQNMASWSQYIQFHQSRLCNELSRRLLYVHSHNRIGDDHTLCIVLHCLCW